MRLAQTVAIYDLPDLLCYAAFKHHLIWRNQNVITLYGIKNCDTVKKARNWLEMHEVEYHFHDFRADGLERKKVKLWLDELGWETLVNRRSTSWKALDADARDNMDAASALEAILAQPTLIKRPLLDTGHERFVGFSAASYQKLFHQHTL
jgi:Spx/MgsR family transcriptional regulator